MVKVYKGDNTQESDPFVNKLPEVEPPPHTSALRYDDTENSTADFTETINHVLKQAKEHNVDYVYVQSSSLCSECAKYNLRVYCISGKDKRFPKLPDYIRKHASHCGFLIYSFIPGINYMRLSINKSLQDINEVITYSNRPFVDDRSDEQIESYNRRVKQCYQKWFDSINGNQAKLEYEQIKERFPDIAPKSQGAYYRMKKSNAKSYKAIVDQAIKAGIEIKEIVTKIDE